MHNYKALKAVQELSEQVKTLTKRVKELEN